MVVVVVVATVVDVVQWWQSTGHCARRIAASSMDTASASSHWDTSYPEQSRGSSTPLQNGDVDELVADVAVVVVSLAMVVVVEDDVAVVVSAVVRVDVVVIVVVVLAMVVDCSVVVMEVAVARAVPASVVGISVVATPVDAVAVVDLEMDECDALKAAFSLVTHLPQRPGQARRNMLATWLPFIKHMGLLSKVQDGASRNPLQEESARVPAAVIVVVAAGAAAVTAVIIVE